MVTKQSIKESSPDKLLEAASQLSAAELEQFVEQVVKLLEERRAPVEAMDESALLMQINREIPISAQNRYKVLRRKLQRERLTEDEHIELISISDELEQMQAQRLDALVKLAQLRNTTLRGVMTELGITMPKVA